MSVRELRQEVIDSIQEHLAVLAAGHPIGEMGETIEATVAGFQALGVSNLLLGADRDGLFKNLVLSGYGRRYYLRKCREASVTDALHLASSRTESFLDLLAAGDHGTAREIAELSPREWIPDGEYEDDFCYRALLHALVAEPRAPEQTLEGLLLRWESALEGGSSPRLELARALVADDAPAFRAGFERLLAARDEELAEQELTDDPAAFARRSLFVEGLALLELGQRRGIELKVEHELCPSLARNPPAPPRPDDLFQEIEAQFGL